MVSIDKIEYSRTVKARDRARSILSPIQDELNEMKPHWYREYRMVSDGVDTSINHHPSKLLVGMFCGGWIGTVWGLFVSYGFGSYMGYITSTILLFFMFFSVLSILISIQHIIGASYLEIIVIRYNSPNEIVVFEESVAEICERVLNETKWSDEQLSIKMEMV